LFWTFFVKKLASPAYEISGSFAETSTLLRDTGLQ
jgi:hypothetical protein